MEEEKEVNIYKYFFSDTVDIEWTEIFLISELIFLFLLFCSTFVSPFRGFGGGSGQKVECMNLRGEFSDGWVGEWPPWLRGVIGIGCNVHGLGVVVERLDDGSLAS